MARGKKPTPRPNRGIAPTAELPPEDSGAKTPVFCFHHIVKDFDVECLTREQQAALARTLQQRAKLTWTDIIQAPKHGQGQEFISASNIKATIPRRFSDQDRFTVFRYNGKLPMVGVRTENVFHILWIERTFGDVYDHE